MTAKKPVRKPTTTAAKGLVAVRLTDAQRRQAEGLGGGNASEGIRRALAQAGGEEPYERSLDLIDPAPVFAAARGWYVRASEQGPVLYGPLPGTEGFNQCRGWINLRGGLLYSYRLG